MSFGARYSVIVSVYDSSCTITAQKPIFVVFALCSTKTKHMRLIEDLRS